MSEENTVKRKDPSNLAGFRDAERGANKSGGRMVSK